MVCVQHKSIHFCLFTVTNLFSLKKICFLNNRQEKIHNIDDFDQNNFNEIDGKLWQKVYLRF